MNKTNYPPMGNAPANYNCLGYVKKFFSQPLFGITIILYSVAALISIVSVFFPQENYFKMMLNSMFDSGAFPSGSGLEYLYPSATAVQTSSVIGGIISVLISSSFTLVPLLFIYFKSKNSSITASPKGGFTFLYVISMIGFVCAWIVFPLLIVGCIIFAVIFSTAGSSADVLFSMTGVARMDYYDYYYYESDDFFSDLLKDTTEIAVVFFIIMAVVLLIVGAVVITYTAAQKNFFKSVKNSVNSPYLYNKGAKTFGVFSIVFASFSALGLLFSIPSLLISSGTAVLPLLSSAFTAAYLFTLGIVAIKYSGFAVKSNNEIQTFYNSMAMNQQPPQAAPYAQPQPAMQYSAPAYQQTPNGQQYSAPVNQQIPNRQPYSAPVNQQMFNEQQYSAPAYQQTPNEQQYSAPVNQQMFNEQQFNSKSPSPVSPSQSDYDNTNRPVDYNNQQSDYFTNDQNLGFSQSDIDRLNQNSFMNNGFGNDDYNNYDGQH